MKNKFLIIFLALLLIISPCAKAKGDASSMVLRQAYIDTPEMKLYFDVFDSSDNLVDSIESSQLTATLGEKKINVKSVQPFIETEEGVAYIFLVDVSTSVAYYFKQMCDSMIKWIDTAGTEDKIAILTYGQGVKLIQDFTSDKAILKSKVSSLKAIENQTQLYNGIIKGIEMGRRRSADLPTRRAIITFSDGKDDCSGGFTKQEVLDKMREDSIPVYTIGFYYSPLNDIKRGYLNALGEIARTSGGEYYQIGTKKLPDIYSEIHKKIQSGFEAVLSCEDSKADGSIYRLQINLTDGTWVMNDGISIRLLPNSEKTIPAQPVQAIPEEKKEVEANNLKVSFWYYAGGILTLIVLLILISKILRRRRKTVRTLNAGKLPQRKPGNLNTEIMNNPNRGMKIRLTLTGKSKESPDYETNLAGSIVIGISDIAEKLGVFDCEISQEHCEIALEDNMLFIRDLDSEAGTYINGVQITGKCRLHNSDLILLGRTEIMIIFDLLQ